MNFVEMRRRHIAWNIAQNPSTISIHRKLKQRAGGGYEEVETDLPPITVRLFISHNQLPQEVSTTAGTKHTDRVYSLLANENADIQASTTVIDRFTVNGESYLVRNVHPQVVQGVVVGYQVDLERVN
ncbi:hypothetical protein [Paenibacillus apii]|uniref:hypothetical protein n=1 Tax=Paenibacillus apii TaxID=1850370 RepID=UPI00143BB5A4|nr:hypothetical protein [Paenibacillus apii]NJJ37827.1 hypothetical protein [Paenibacillus apii]